MVGAICETLGGDTIGVWGIDTDIFQELLKAGKSTGERVWRLPILSQHRALVVSKCSDIKQAGN
jgi:leucyl aminopeptidase